MAILRILKPLYRDERPLLRYGSPFQLLVATILSAQCSDEQVNGVTPGLFARWPDASSLAQAPLDEVEKAVRSTGFYRMKARNIVAASRMIMEDFGGSLPVTIEGLCLLPGAGRKTANLVASACFGQPGLIADTHFIRVAFRLGLAEGRANRGSGWKGVDPAALEEAMREVIAPTELTAFSYALNRHGKFTCRARKPSCETCPLGQLCPRLGL